MDGIVMEPVWVAVGFVVFVVLVSVWGGKSLRFIVFVVPVSVWGAKTLKFVFFSLRPSVFGEQNH